MLKKTYKYIGSVFVLCLIISKGFGQDFHLSQYDASPMYLNPAPTGQFIGKYRIHGHYRNQWASITTPFTTSSLSFDMPYKKLGIGGLIINNRAGEGNFNALKLVSSLSYSHPIDSMGNHQIAGGIQIGFIHKSVNLDKLIFHNQYTYTNSGGFDPGIPNGEIFSNSSLIAPEVAASILYFFANSHSRFNPFIGFTAFHLTQPAESFYSNEENKLPRRFVTHAGTNINISDKIQILPKFLHMKQGNVNELGLSIVGNYFLINDDAWVFFGPIYRLFKMKDFDSKDALVFLGGLKYGKFTYRASYDVNISPLNSISSGKGGFELSVTYQISDIELPPYTCPRL